MTTAGDCSWKPQPSCSPAARSASRAPRQRDERDDDAGRERDALACAACNADRACPVGECQHLQRQHRETRRASGSAAVRRRTRTRARAASDSAAADSTPRNPSQYRPGGLGACCRRSGDSDVERHRVDDSTVDAEAGVGRQHALQPRKPRRELVRNRQRQIDAAIALSDRLRCGRLDPRSRSAKNETRRCDSSPAATCSAIVAPDAVACAFHAAGAARGSASRVDAIRDPQRLSTARVGRHGQVSLMSAPSGMHVSLQTSQSARAASVAGVPPSRPPAPSAARDGTLHLRIHS